MRSGINFRSAGVFTCTALIALALGAAGYHHHAEQRDPELQTLDALLAGDAVMPWKPAESGSTAYIVCELNDGRPTCEVRPTAG